MARLERASICHRFLAPRIRKATDHEMSAHRERDAQQRITQLRRLALVVLEQSTEPFMADDIVRPALPLLFSDMDIATVVVIVLSVTALGYVCASSRARTGSLRPAIAAHVMFNVGGVVAGVIYAISYRVATGHIQVVVGARSASAGMSSRWR